MPKFKNSNATFWVVLKHCVKVAFLLLLGGCLLRSKKDIT